MKPWARFTAWTMQDRLIGLGFVSLCFLQFASPLIAQEASANQVIHSEIKHLSAAEARSVTKDSGFFPDRQPEVYWHDENWKIGLTPQSSSNAFSLSITSSDGIEKIVKLPWNYSQIDSISRAPNDKAIVTADINGMTQSFCIIDLRLGKLIDDIGLYDPSVSPNRSFILYNNWFPPHAGGENLYRIYDVLKAPRENTCGYRKNDPRHEDLSGGLRGFQVYPQRAGQVHCDDLEDEDDDNQNASDFIWAADSSKVVFANVRDGVISLILVTMPHSDRDKDHNRDRDMDHDGDHDRDHQEGHEIGNDLPHTSVYKFLGTEDVCAGATTCDSNNVRSIAWDGESVKVVLIQANPTGKAIEKNLTIPLTKLIPIGK